MFVGSGCRLVGDLSVGIVWNFAKLQFFKVEKANLILKALF